MSGEREARLKASASNPLWHAYEALKERELRHGPGLRWASAVASIAEALDDDQHFTSFPCYYDPSEAAPTKGCQCSPCRLMRALEAAEAEYRER